MVPDNLTVTVAVLGMAALTLLMASLYATYQRAQAYRRLKIQQVLMKAHQAEEILSCLAGVSLPRDVRLALRQEIADRYKRVRALHRGYKSIDRLVSDSQQRLSAEPGDAGKVLPVPADTRVFDQWQHGFHDLMMLLQGGLSTPQSADQRQKLTAQALERQAECIFGHFMNQADKQKSENRKLAARGQIQQLIDWLRALGLHTERVQELLAQAEEAYQYLLKDQTTAAEAGPVDTDATFQAS